jgi:hypothetical protein
MFTLQPLVSIKIDFKEAEDITKLFSFLHLEKIAGKWTAHHVTHFDGTFPPAAAERVVLFLKSIGVMEKQ